MAKPVKPIAKNVPPKKKAAKKSTAVNKNRAIKYEDKSAGQPELAPIYNALKQLLTGFAKGNLQVQYDAAGQFHLHTNKTVELQGRKRDGLFFASLLVQKGYVGFYLVPVYTDVVLKNEIAPELLKCLKGTSCFHIKKLDETLKQQIQQVLQASYVCYEKKGWV
jgi:hypothetical protein